MLDLDLLATFHDVHRAGSITAGAARAGLSPATVSERVARLEAQLGTPLFTRSKAGTAPTAAGDRLAGQVGEWIDRLRTVAIEEPEPARTVRIGGASDVIAARIIPALAPLTEHGLALTFDLGLTAALIERLRAGELDLVIASQRLSVAGVRYRGLIDEEFVLVGAPSLARTIDVARRAADPAAALAHLPLVAYDADLSIVRRYWRSQFGARPSNPVRVIVPDLRGILAAVIAGVGISALPRYLVEPAVAAGSVEVLHRPDEPPINTLHLAITPGGASDPAVARVIDRLVDRARTWDVF